MEKLASKRNYFDYNATSPLSKSVKDWLGKGDFSYANPSSGHSSGKSANYEVQGVFSDILNTFNISKSHDIFFHSGATEGINTIVKGFAHSLALEGKKLHFFHSSIDHAAASDLRGYLEFYGHFVHTWAVDEKAQFDFEKLKKEIALCPSGTALVNYTYVNNEVGVVWPLEEIKSLKDETGAIIHVDAVQSPGKVENWEKILPELDFYTYSSHKFGGLKGIGFTFVSRVAPSIEPLLRGGGQQGGKRSGTLNTMGIISTKLALQDLKKNYKAQESFDSIDFLRTKLRHLLGHEGRIIVCDAPCKNSNTIFFIIDGKDSNSLMMAFDLGQIDVGTGSACSSGILTPNKTLINLGCSEKEAQSGIRLSFEPNLNLVKAKSYWDKINKVLQKVLS